MRRILKRKFLYLSCNFFHELFEIFFKDSMHRNIKLPFLIFRELYAKIIYNYINKSIIILS